MVIKGLLEALAAANDATTIVLDVFKKKSQHKNFKKQINKKCIDFAKKKKIVSVLVLPFCFWAFFLYIELCSALAASLRHNRMHQCPIAKKTKQNKNSMTYKPDNKKSKWGYCWCFCLINKQAVALHVCGKILMQSSHAQRTYSSFDRRKKSWWE